MYTAQIEVKPSEINAFVTLMEKFGFKGSPEDGYLGTPRKWIHNYPWVVIDKENEFYSGNQTMTTSGKIRVLDTFNDLLLYLVGPSFKPIEVKLNDDYTATVEQDEVIVGCQSFTFDKVDELAKAVAKARGFSSLDK